MTNDEAVWEFEKELSLRRRLKERTVKSYILTVESALRFLKKHFSKIEKNDLEDFIYYLQKEGYSARTIHKHATALRVFFRFYHSDVAEGIHLPALMKSPKTSLKPEEIERLLCTVLHPRDSAIMQLLCYPGLKISELITLNRSSIEEDGIHLEFRGKEKSEVVPVADATREVISMYLGDRKDRKAALFVNKLGDRLSDRSVQLMIKKYARMAEISRDLIASLLRDSFSDYRSQDPDAATLLLSKSTEVVREFQKSAMIGGR